MRRVIYVLPDIYCDRCASTIQRGLAGMDGIVRVTVDVVSKRVVVDYDAEATTTQAVEEKLERAGFPPAEKVADRPLADDAAVEPAAARPEMRGRSRAGYWVLAAGVLLLALAGYSGYVLYPRFGLTVIEGATLLVLASGAGVASFFSPCSFPLLVTLLAQQAKAETPAGKARIPLGRALSFASALSVGAALFLLLSGLVIALGGEVLFAGVTFTSPAGRIIRVMVGQLLILLGLMQVGVLPFSLHMVEHLSRPLLRWQAQQQRSRPAVGFGILGFGYVLAGFG
jgi:cytochrome c biogenesis protein CcdA/copper chaperone CopZ